MKRKLLCIMMILALGMSILYYANLPDYLVLNSLSCSNGLNRDTTLKVVVYRKRFIIDRIANFQLL